MDFPGGLVVKILSFHWRELSFDPWMGYCSFPGGLDGKASAYNAGDPGSIPGSGRSSGEGNGTPLQYSCLENPMDEEPGRLQSMGSQRVRHDWATSLSLWGTKVLHATSLKKKKECWRRFKIQIYILSCSLELRTFLHKSFIFLVYQCLNRK